jgi:hypothetical protein
MVKIIWNIPWGQKTCKDLCFHILWNSTAPNNSETSVLLWASSLLDLYLQTQWLEWIFKVHTCTQAHSAHAHSHTSSFLNLWRRLTDVFTLFCLLSISAISVLTCEGYFLRFIWISFASLFPSIFFALFWNKIDKIQVHIKLWQYFLYSVLFNVYHYLREFHCDMSICE